MRERIQYSNQIYNRWRKAPLPTDPKENPACRARRAAGADVGARHRSDAPSWRRDRGGEDDPVTEEY